MALVALLAFVPAMDFGLGKALPGALSSPGTLQLFCLCLVFAGVALSYDLLFGFTGLLSFGHALYFAIGVYVADIAITQWSWTFAEACLAAAVSGVAVALVVGSISLRTAGIAFAMVTLAFAQAGSILVQKNPHSWTGGEQGLGYDYTAVPAAFVGVHNTKNLYWLSLGFAVVVALIAGWAVDSSPGHVWQAIRENERRVEVLGLRTRGYKLLSFVLGSFLATMGGDRLPARRRRRRHGRDDCGLHARAPGDGRARRHRDAVGAAARRFPLHVREPAAGRARRLERGPGSARACCGLRSPSRCSSSA